jgi:hypothetical protein
MAPEKKLAASVPDEFDVPPLDAAKGKSFKIKLKGPGKSKYEIWQKDSTDDAPPTKWIDPNDGQEKTLTWYNSFGLKPKGQDKFQDVVEEYDIEVDEPAPGVVLVYYANKKVTKFKDVKGVGTGKLTVSLKLGDPAFGTTP